MTNQQYEQYPHLDTILYLWENKRQLSISDQIRIGSITFHIEKLEKEGRDDKALLQELEQKAIDYFISRNITI
jgi:hypothetical protein